MVNTLAEWIAKDVGKVNISRGEKHDYAQRTGGEV
jgi:hypothetical protein